MYHRLLNLDLPPKQSAFLWGARQTGKSTYLKHHFPGSLWLDLLLTDVFNEYLVKPSLLREQVLNLSETQKKKPIIIDEIQKVPALLDEVHYLIENHNASFILCGSSARKLKRGGANLLGGRAWRFECYPLTSAEIPNFDLHRALSQGLLPKIYDSTPDNAQRALKAYVIDYLREEIQAEGLTRNLPAFTKFLDIAAFSSGEMLNFNNIATDCGVNAKTIKAYFQILYDTLLAYEVTPYAKNVKRNLIQKHSKFYYFDVGVYNYLAKKPVLVLEGENAGKAFEHWILMELMAYKGYKERRDTIHYWRTRTGLEVDFVIPESNLAIEVKISKRVRPTELKGLNAFIEEHPDTKAYVVSQDIFPRRLENGITILPWQEFIKRLWSDQL